MSRKGKGFSLKRATDLSAWTDCQRLQRQVWGMSDLEILPIHIIRVLAEGGGLVMNAYDNAGRPVGTTLSFPLYYDGKPILYSHMTGVTRTWQNKGVGLVLKLEQRKFALKNGFDLICWTYDPLRGQNNWFNLNKLGAISRTYYANYYGSMSAKLYMGQDSDRFLVEWWVKSPRVKKRLKVLGKTKRKPATLEHQTIVNTTAIKDGVRTPVGKLNFAADAKSILLEIPTDINQLRNRSPSTLRWRTDTRQLYAHYFKSGYFATETIVDESADRRTFVKLERGPLKRILLN